MVALQHSPDELKPDPSREAGVAVAVRLSPSPSVASRPDFNLAVRGRRRLFLKLIAIQPLFAGEIVITGGRKPAQHRT
jgi:hypothetical protein